MHLFRKYLLSSLILLLMLPSVAESQETDAPQILWLLNDQLWLNDRQLMQNNVLDAVLSPDGTYIAVLTFDARGNTASNELIVLETATATEVARLAEDALPTIDDMPAQISTPQWRDNNMLLFNTLQILGGPGGIVNQDDLWQFDLDGNLTMLLPVGEGGVFLFSPNREHMAMVHSGVYEDSATPGTIQVLDATTLSPVNEAFTFDAVATGTIAPWIPPLQWSDDSDTLAFVIPDPDIVYAAPDALPAAQDCRMTVNETQCEVITIGFPVQAVWSGNLQQVAFQRSVAINQWELVTRRNAVERTSPPSGALPEPLLWMDDTLLFRELGLSGATYNFFDTEDVRPWELSIIDLQAIDNRRIALIIGTFEQFTLSVYDVERDIFTDIMTSGGGFPQFTDN